MTLLGLYRDPIIARMTSASDWRIADLLGAERPVSLYLVVPPSDISRTRPLVRLILNQIGRRLTERYDAHHAASDARQLLFMLDEFPALGRLDFFESALAYLAAYRRAGVPGGAVAAPDRQGLRAQPLHPRQLPRARGLHPQRRAHGQAPLRHARHLHPAQGPEQPVGAPALGVALAHDGVRAGDAAAAADAGRDPAAARPAMRW